MARPIEYDDSFLEKANEYLAACNDIEEDKENGIRHKVNVPTKGGLAVYLGIHRDTLYDWASKYPLFSDVMERVGAMQEERLINKGLSGDYNPTIAKVLLTKHGYREGIEQSGEGGRPIEFSVADPKAKALAAEYENKLKEGL